jgi:hypothetical protein
LLLQLPSQAIVTQRLRLQSHEATRIHCFPPELPTRNSRLIFRRSDGLRSRRAEDDIQLPSETLIGGIQPMTDGVITGVLQARQFGTPSLVVQETPCPLDSSTPSSMPERIESDKAWVGRACFWPRACSNKSHCSHHLRAKQVAASAQMPPRGPLLLQPREKREKSSASAPIIQKLAARPACLLQEENALPSFIGTGQTRFSFPGTADFCSFVSTLLECAVPFSSRARGRGNGNLLIDGAATTLSETLGFHRLTVYNGQGRNERPRRETELSIVRLQSHNWLDSIEIGTRVQQIQAAG